MLHGLQLQTGNMDTMMDIIFQITQKHSRITKSVVKIFWTDILILKEIKQNQPRRKNIMNHNTFGIVLEYGS